MEEEGKVVFLHKVMEGHADKSYGIHVAELAELPDQMIKRARTILAELETTHYEDNDSLVQQKQEKQSSLIVESNNKRNESQMSFFAEPEISAKLTQHKDGEIKKDKQILNLIGKLDLLSMTPLDAINELYKIQKMLKS